MLTPVCKIAHSNCTSLPHNYLGVIRSRAPLALLQHAVSMRTRSTLRDSSCVLSSAPSLLVDTHDCSPRPHPFARAGSIAYLVLLCSSSPCHIRCHRTVPVCRSSSASAPMELSPMGSRMPRASTGSLPCITHIHQCQVCGRRYPATSCPKGPPFAISTQAASWSKW